MCCTRMARRKLIIAISAHQDLFQINKVKCRVQIFQLLLPATTKVATIICHDCNRLALDVLLPHFIQGLVSAFIVCESFLHTLVGKKDLLPNFLSSVMRAVTR